jgi:hypothetical protein
MHRIFILYLLLLIGCSGLEKAQQAKIRKGNEVKDPIVRLSSELYFTNSLPRRKEKEKYPWEERYIGSFTKITKESFRCRGSSSHGERMIINSDGLEERLVDCEGLGSHSLPVREGEEFIYDILIDLLNHVQAKNKKRVIITSGYRCPIHNRYCNHTKINASSKHQIGGEVDFYVEGMEQDVEVIVEQLIDYYKEQEPSYQQFRKVIREKNGIQYPVWSNKEISISISHYKISGDLDNAFSHPYITIDLKLDRERGERVEYSWQKANNGYMRY